MLPLRPNLRLKIAVALSSVTVAAVFSTGCLLIHYSYNKLKEQKTGDELVIARNIAAQVEETLKRTQYIVDALAKDADIRSMDPVKQRRALTLANDIAEIPDGIVILDPKGRLVAVNAGLPSAREFMPKSPYETCVRPAQVPGGSRFSDIYKSQTDEPAMMLSVPVMENGRLLAVVAGGTLIDKHSMGGISRISIGQTGYAEIIDRHGQIVIQPRRGKREQNLDADPEELALFVKKQGVAEFVNAKGVPILAAFAQIPDTGWGVIVRQESSESFATANSMVVMMLALLCISLFAAVAVSALLAERFVRPITALAQGVREIADGRLDARIRVNTDDEFGDLARSINTMAQKLEVHMAEITTAHGEVLQAEKQLAQSEKLAAIGQLAAGLAHEIYNPLNVISGFAEFLLQKTGVADLRRAGLEDIVRESARCQRLVAQLLNFAKPKEVEKVACDMNELVRDTLVLVESQFKAQGIALKKSLAEDLPAVEIDRDQLKQVLLNLLINACQAMPQGGVLSVATRLAAHGVETSVADDGPGIREQDMRNIFDPFFTTKPTGTGLGLALSYAIAERHGGALRAQNRPKRGALFTVTLPAAGRPLEAGAKES
jgi:signal transduction histidine kinase